MILLDEKDSHHCLRTIREELDELRMAMTEKDLVLSDQKDEIRELKSQLALQQYIHESIQCSNCKVQPIKTD